MIKALLLVRRAQVCYVIREMGLFRIAVVCMLLVLAALFLFVQTSKLPNAYFVAAAIFLVLLNFHIRRSDKRFLKIAADNSRCILRCEYLLLASPVLACLLWHGQWLTLAALVLGLVMLPFVRVGSHRRSLNTRLQWLIPSQCFEWKGGIRSNFWVVCIVWLLGLLASPFVGSVPAVLLLLFLIVLRFYEQNEPLDFVLAYGRGASAFVRRKIVLLLALFWTIAAPLLLLFVAFHLDLWYIPLAQMAITTVALTFVVVVKYAYYVPSDRSGGNQVLVAFGIIGSFIPFLLPVVLIMVLVLFKKACANLNFYLNDYD